MNVYNDLSLLQLIHWKACVFNNVAILLKKFLVVMIYL